MTRACRGLDADDAGRDLSGYRSMWLFAMFDLPVTDKEARRQYAAFRKALLQQGFCMLQFSVYARHCASEESSDAIRQRIRSVLPPEGQVRVVAITDRQFGKMEVYFGKNRSPTEDPPAQFMLF
jgi:CRISPR-associated protein Cas2